MRRVRLIIGAAVVVFGGFFATSSLLSAAPDAGNCPNTVCFSPTDEICLFTEGQHCKRSWEGCFTACCDTDC